MLAYYIQESRSMALKNVDLMSENINLLLFFYVGQSAPSPWLSWSLTHFVGVDVRVSYHLRYESRSFPLLNVFMTIVGILRLLGDQNFRKLLSCLGLVQELPTLTWNRSRTRVYTEEQVKYSMQYAMYTMVIVEPNPEIIVPEMNINCTQSYIRSMLWKF